MSFDDPPVIPVGHIFRAALVSPDRGERALKELTKAGLIKPTITPTGRVLVTPPDGKRVYNAIVAA